MNALGGRSAAGLMNLDCSFLTVDLRGSNDLLQAILSGTIRWSHVGLRERA
jgi:hypothetical protein